jgi:hypothetical protein
MLISPIQFQKINLARAEATQHWDGCTELDAANRADLLDHLLRLDRCEKNNRFQSGASDSFITRYYLGINWDRHVAIAWRQYGLVIGIAELASPTKSWRQPELAISVAWRGDADYVRRRLLEAACIAAQKRGAVEVIIWFASEEEWPPQLAREYGGAVDCLQQCAAIPLRDVENVLSKRIAARCGKSGIKIV